MDRSQVRNPIHVLEKLSRSMLLIQNCFLVAVSPPKAAPQPAVEKKVREVFQETIVEHLIQSNLTSRSPQ